MKLDSRQRIQRFQAMSPEDKAAVVQTHAQRWLEKNRGRLSTSQIALVQEAIDLVTPALYRDPNAPEQVQKYKELSAKLTCQMRVSDVREAFGAL